MVLATLGSQAPLAGSISTTLLVETADQATSLVVVSLLGRRWELRKHFLDRNDRAEPLRLDLAVECRKVGAEKLIEPLLCLVQAVVQQREDVAPRLRRSEVSAPRNV